MHSDHLGTPRLLSDEGNKPVWQWPHSAFGNNEPIGWLTGSSAEQPPKLKATKPLLEVNLRFPGQYFDEETKLAYNLRRSYMPGQGRYTQADPIGLSGDINRHIYASARPLSLSDPFGLDPWWKENPDPWYPDSSTPPFQCRPDGNPWGWGCGDKNTDHRVPDVVGGVNLLSACRRHDDCYGNASSPGASKAVCDEQFRKDIYASCRASGRGDYYCKSLSYTYFKGVDVGGGDAWNRAKAGK